MPAELLDPLPPRPSYSTCMLLDNVLRILAADGCKIVMTTKCAGPGPAARLRKTVSSSLISSTGTLAPGPALAPRVP
jgi:hypothetical protein